MLFNSNPLYGYERVSWYETSTFNLLLFGGCYVLLLTTLVLAFVGIFNRQKKSPSDFHLPGIARLWALVLSVIFLLAPIFVIIFSELDYKLPIPFYMMVALAFILATSILVCGPVIFTIFAWQRRFWSVTGRLHYTLVTIALLGMVWLMYSWRLLGFRY
jgi:NADH:ubiquinone oxidoreductase subunit 2 (subunit N)